MAEDWSIDVRKYVPDADEAAIAGIVKHCGIALRSRDASLVSFTDPDELLRVRESFCRKKLGLTDPDDVLDAAIAKVGEIMKADTTKNRVTVYYLLAQMFGKLGLFGGAAAATAAVAAPAPEPEPEPVREPVAAAVPLAAAAPVAAAAAAPVRAAQVPERERRRPDAGIWRTGAIAGAVLVAGIAGAWLLSQIIADRSTNETPARPTAAAAPAIPTGYGVIAETIDGKPALNIYFATAERDVSPLGSDAAPIAAYIASHPGERVSVSGYVDPRGDAAFNEQLARDRAVNTANALVAAGVPADRIDLDKPTDIVGDDPSLAEKRVVTVRIKMLGIVQDPASVERTQATP